MLAYFHECLRAWKKGRGCVDDGKRMLVCFVLIGGAHANADQRKINVFPDLQQRVEVVSFGCTPCRPVVLTR